MVKADDRYGIIPLLRRSVLQIVRRPIYWVSMFLMPLFFFVMLTSLMSEGLPWKVPAAIVNLDGSEMSRNVTRTLADMQLIDLREECESFTEARHAMQEGRIYGFFVIPRDYQANLLAGRAPVITFYTNMVYYVPGSLLFKSFKTTALYTKAGTAVRVLNTVGAPQDMAAPLLQPVSISTRGLANPGLNYGIYLANSFAPALLQLMIFLVTCFSITSEIKYGTSVQWMRMARGSVLRAVTTRLLPQTLIWWVMAIFMEAWLFKWNAYPMHGSWWWITLSELMFVLAAQGFALFVVSVLPNMRLSLSVCALVGILTFSVAAYSFPAESMYGGIRIFSWLPPARYNFLIYIDQALNGRHIYYSRFWFIAYIGFMLAPFTMLWRLKRSLLHPVYAP